MGYSAIAVANYFIDKARAANREVTHLQLQKLVYLAHGWHLALHELDYPLIFDEYAEAWKHGPVFPSLYHELKKHGSDPIKSHVQDVRMNPAGSIELITPGVRADDTEVVRLLDRIYEVYGGWTGGQLISLTHRSGTPWDRMTNSGTAIKRNEHISDDDIREYFESIMQERRQ